MCIEEEMSLFHLHLKIENVTKKHETHGLHW